MAGGLDDGGREAGLTREDMDRFAMHSHHKAVAARERLAEEIVPVYLPPKFEKVIEHDDGPREGQSMEALAKLKTVFERKTGAVTAGNASQVTDGAVAMLVMTETRAAQEGLEPLGILTGYTYAGCDPKRMGLGPVYAMQPLMERHQLDSTDVDYWEINEAFAAQVLACDREMQLDHGKLNVNGGSIALGHPIGCTGARIVTTLLHEMVRRESKLGLATLCVSGGMGGALILERV